MLKLTCETPSSLPFVELCDDPVLVTVADRNPTFDADLVRIPARGARGVADRRERLVELRTGRSS